MKNIIHLFKGFLQRAGHRVFIATFVSRISSFLTHLIILQFITEEKLGVVIYTLSIVAFLIPMAGLGVQQSLIRYGALLKTDKEKEALFIYTLKNGIIITLLIIVIIFIISNNISFEFEKINFYFKILSFSILTQFLLTLVRIYFRLQLNNKKYAIVEISYSIVFIISATILSYFYKEIGYITAIVIAPLIIFLYFIKQLKIKFKTKNTLSFTGITFWKYGFFAGLSNVATILLLKVDNLLIGNILLDAKEVTLYTYISLIPISLLYLPRILITTDFVFLTKKNLDKDYIFNYIKSYILIFTLLSVSLLITSYFFADKILLLFGKEYAAHSKTFMTLIFGVSGILILRGLFGNLLASIGKANLNFYIAIIALIINVVSNYYFIPKYGILGASITSAIIMWTTGIMTFILFYIYYNKLIK